MKIRLLGTLVGLLISFALPILAQQKETVDPQTIEQLIAFRKKYDETENNNDAASLAALYTKDAVLVTNTGPVFGRQAIEKWFTDDFQEWRHSNKLSKGDQNPPRIIGTADNIASSGEWSVTIQGKTGDPIQLKGHFSSILTREGNDWKIRMSTWNVTPAQTAPQAGRTQRINQEISKPTDTN
jgi:ketosteroid isomerase-like protein